jgi:CheY-like chemotaxis protein
MPLQEFLHDVAALLRQRCDDKHLELTVDIATNLPEFVHTDANRLALIVHQLLQNAVKFTTFGRVTLTARWLADNLQQTTNNTPQQPNGEPDDRPESNPHQSSRHENGWLEIAIEDTGIGMDVELLPELLKGFRQADSRFSRRYEGLGIGLATCQRILDLMGGELQIQSQRKHGTQVRVRIPMRTLTAIKPIPFKPLPVEAASPGGDNSPPPQILIVEDNPVNQLIIVKMVTAMGYQTLTANDGQQALQLLADKHADLILMDCQMPHMDGFEATQAIRKLPGECAGIPIIAVTANAMARDRERCFEVGMNDYIKKPISKHVLGEKIIHWLTR